MASPVNDTSPTDVELQLADQLSAELVRLMRGLHKTKSAASLPGSDGVERAAYVLLFCLVHEGPQRTGKLAEALHSEISTISRQTRFLVSQGLVERRADPDDGRACLLAATVEGQRVFEQNRRHRTVWLATLLAHWSPEDRKALSGLLGRFNTEVEAHLPAMTSIRRGLE